MLNLPIAQGWLTCIFPWSTIDSQTIGGTPYQVLGYWSSTDYLIVGVRTLPNGAWTLYHYNGTAGLPTCTKNGAVWSAHENISIALDAAGYIHVSYGMHDTAFQYRKSDAPVTSWAGGLSALTQMHSYQATGTWTYPQFFKDPLGVVYFAIRQGGANTAEFIMYSYSTATGLWSTLAGSGANGVIVNGKASAPHRGVYQFTPTFSRDWDGAGTGYLHFAWNWYRVGYTYERTILHVRWDGTSWTKWTGAAQTMPCTPANSTAIKTVTAPDTLFGQSVATIDANNRYHILAFVGDAWSLQHSLADVYFDGAAWQTTMLTNYTVAPYISSSDPLGYGDFHMPAIYCDYATNTMNVLIGRNTAEDSETGIAKLSSAAGSFSASWTETTFNATDLGHTQVSYDKWQLDTTGDLYVFTQRCRNMVGDTPATEYPLIIENGVLAGVSYSFGGII